MSCAENETLSAAIVDGPSVNLLEPSKVLITWETDIPGNSIVEYGLDTTLDSIYVDDEERQFHNVILSGLSFNKTYYYRISSISASFDTEVTSKIDSFTTSENTISIVTAPIVEFIDPTEVVITWDTDTTGNSIVEYGINNNLDSSYFDYEEVKFHSVSLTNLMPDTIYYYRVISISQGIDAQVSSMIDTFTTIEGIINIISLPVVESISPVEVQITWDTDVSGNSIVDYGMTSGLGEQIVDSEEQLSHGIVLTGLTPDTQYYYRVTSISSVLDAQVSSTIDSFTTSTSEINIVMGPTVEVVSSTEVLITWDTDIIGNSIIDYSTTTNLDSQVVDLTEQLSHSIMLTDLVADSTYYYQVTSVSSALNVQVSSEIDTFVTSGLWGR
jgi:phosphodiesterase/alkaline phosphatase D-like protein